MALSGALLAGCNPTGRPDCASPLIAVDYGHDDMVMIPVYTYDGKGNITGFYMNSMISHSYIWKCEEQR